MPTVSLIKVIVYDLRTGEMIREADTHYSTKHGRKWLAQLCVWAWSNGYLVETLYNDRNLPIDEMKARAECARRRIDPDELCADGGVTAWMVVDKELKKA